MFFLYYYITQVEARHFRRRLERKKERKRKEKEKEKKQQQIAEDNEARREADE